LDGKVAVVTSGSEAIGYSCTHTLLDHNISKLFIFSKSEDVISDALSAIRFEMSDVAAKKVEWMQCDLSDRTETEELHLRLQIRQTGLIFSSIMLREVS
jgi:short-subunit dehydrogenase